jgi:transposase-like protein
MPKARRLTRNERFAVTKAREKGVSAKALAEEYGITTRAVFYIVRSEKERRDNEGTRSVIVNVRLTEHEAAEFDSTLSRRNIRNRTDALRALIGIASDLLVPDEHMSGELRGLSASLNRVGNNVNQIAQRLNQAREKGQKPPYDKTSDAVIRELAGLIFDLSDQVEDLVKRRRAGLDLMVSPALRGLVHGAV